MRLYIVRHAEPDYTNDTITADGHLEAKALGERLAEEGLDKIFCSPLGRAIDTMKYTSRDLKISYNIEEWIKEIPDLGLKESPWGSIPAWDIPGESIRGGR